MFFSKYFLFQFFYMEKFKLYQIYMKKQHTHNGVDCGSVCPLSETQTSTTPTHFSGIKVEKRIKMLSGDCFRSKPNPPFFKYKCRKKVRGSEYGKLESSQEIVFTWLPFNRIFFASQLEVAQLRNVASNIGLGKKFLSAVQAAGTLTQRKQHTHAIYHPEPRIHLPHPLEGSMQQGSIQ